MGLGSVVRELAAQLRASDTFKLVTTEGATRLARRAAERRTFIGRLRQNMQGHTASPQEMCDFDAAVRLAESEAALQEKFADWLRSLAGDEGDA